MCHRAGPLPLEPLQGGPARLAIPASVHAAGATLVTGATGTTTAVNPSAAAPIPGLQLLTATRPVVPRPAATPSPPPGWPFGRSVFRGAEVFQVIQAVAGVDHVTALELSGDRGTAGLRQPVRRPVPARHARRPSNQRPVTGGGPPQDVRALHQPVGPTHQPPQGGAPARGRPGGQRGYEMWLRRLHVVALHDTWGIALGLTVSQDEPSRGVVVRPGVAYYVKGRPLLVSARSVVPNPFASYPAAAATDSFDLVLIDDAERRPPARRPRRRPLPGVRPAPPAVAPAWNWRPSDRVRLGLDVPLVRASRADPTAATNPAIRRPGWLSTIRSGATPSRRRGRMSPRARRPPNSRGTCGRRTASRRRDSRPSWTSAPGASRASRRSSPRWPSTRPARRSRTCSPGSRAGRRRSCTYVAPDPEASTARPLPDRAGGPRAHRPDDGPARRPAVAGVSFRSPLQVVWMGVEAVGGCPPEEDELLGRKRSCCGATSTTIQFRPGGRHEWDGDEDRLRLERPGRRRGRQHTGRLLRRPAARGRRPQRRGRPAPAAPLAAQPEPARLGHRAGFRRLGRHRRPTGHRAAGIRDRLPRPRAGADRAASLAVPARLGDDQGKPVPFVLVAAYPDDSQLEAAETRAGECGGTPGAVRSASVADLLAPAADRHGT